MSQETWKRPPIVVPKIRKRTRFMLRYSTGLAVVVALGLLNCVETRAGELSSTEKRILEFIEAHRVEPIALIEKVVNIPSQTNNLAGVREVGKVFEEEFAKSGFAARWENVPRAMNRAGHMIAEHPGKLGKRVLLIGHLDTVLEGKAFQRETDRPNHARGNGTVDMKGGDVIMLYALKALNEAGSLEDRQVSVILTGDEESAGTPIDLSRASMRALAKSSDVALAFEAADGQTATVARRGVGSWALRVKARPGHSSGIFREESGAGAIYEFARILDEFRRELSGQKGLTINSSLTLGGTKIEHESGANNGGAEGKTNVIPGEAFAHGDFRFLSDAQADAAEAAMRAIVARSLPRTSAAIEFEREYPAMAPTPGNYAVLGVLDQVSRDLNLGGIVAFDPILRGAGDISFAAPFVDGLDGLGAHGSRSHTPDEWMDLDSVPDQIRRAALLIHRLVHEERAAEKPK